MWNWFNQLFREPEKPVRRRLTADEQQQQRELQAALIHHRQEMKRIANQGRPPKPLPLPPLETDD